MASPVLSSDLLHLFSVVWSLSSGFLVAPQRFGDERVGEHELGFRHVVDRQQHLGGFAGRGVVAADARRVAFGAEQQAVPP